MSKADNSLQELKTLAADINSLFPVVNLENFKKGSVSPEEWIKLLEDLKQVNESIRKFKASSTNLINRCQRFETENC